MAAKLSKAAQSQITKLKEQLAKAKATAAKKIADAKAKSSYKKPKKTKTQQVFSAGSWTGSAPKKLTVYKVRLMLDEQQIGIFGPYATIRAASADAKNILRMHVGPGFKIEEIGVDEPLLRSDGKIKVYFHPSVYSAQATDKGVLTAQVIEQGGEAKRKSTFVKKYNPSHPFNVYLGTKKIDTVFDSKSSTAAEVKRSLVNHDGYDPRIRVTKARR